LSCAFPRHNPEHSDFERIIQSWASSWEVIEELNVSHRCSLLIAGEPQDRHAWYIHLLCDDEEFTVSGEEALPNPLAGKIIKNKIKDAIQEHLNVKK
jgi:hypothetical protein